MNIEAALAHFLRREAELPPYPGACCVMVDRWIELQRGFSPLANYGRVIMTDDDVQAWLSEPGGIVVAVNRVMRSAGFAKTGKPVTGDVGLVLHDGMPGDRLPVSMAIKGPLGWHSRNSRGLMMLDSSAGWKAWAV